MHLKGWIKPANNIEYFLTELYKALDNGKKNRPEMKAAAFLMTRYKSEFSAQGIPAFVRKVIVPATYSICKLSGVYKKFKDAPLPVK